MVVLRSSLAQLARSCVLSSLLLPLLFGLGASAASAPPVDERSLRAVTVYHLMAFTAWPPDRTERSGSVRRLCIVTADDELADAFRTLTSRPIGELTLVVERRAEVTSLDDCETVYFDRGEHELSPRLFADLHARSVLTITGGPVGGEIISLNIVGRRLVFDVSAPAMREARIDLSAKVLELARKVWR